MTSFYYHTIIVALLSHLNGFDGVTVWVGMNRKLPISSWRWETSTGGRLITAPCCTPLSWCNPHSNPFFRINIDLLCSVQLYVVWYLTLWPHPISYSEFLEWLRDNVYADASVCRLRLYLCREGTDLWLRSCGGGKSTSRPLSVSQSFGAPPSNIYIIQLLHMCIHAPTHRHTFTYPHVSPLC